MLHDPKNHDEIYQSGMLDYDLDSLRNEFEFFYERKLEGFQDKVDSFRDILMNYNYTHPDKLLASFDKKSSDYLKKTVRPFLESMTDYYGSKIMDIYQEYADQIAEERADFIKDSYDYCLQVYTAAQEYKKLHQQLTKRILELLKQDSPMKQAALVNSFPKEQQNVVKKCVKELLVAGRILRAKKDLSKSGVWFLCFVK